MTVLFFKVEEVLNYAGTEAIAPSGRIGIANDKVKELKKELDELGPGAQLVIYGEWANDWDFDDDKCTADGKYLIKKLDRRGLHIIDKAIGQDPVMTYIHRKHVDKHKVLA